MQWKLLTRYRSLNAAPDPKMPLTRHVLPEDIVGTMPVILRDNDTSVSNGTNATSYFDHDYLTYLDMLDIWYRLHQEDVLFVPPSSFFLLLTKWPTDSLKRPLHVAFHCTRVPSPWSFTLRIQRRLKILTSSPTVTRDYHGWPSSG